MGDRCRIFNSGMGDISQFGNMVVNGYAQVDANELPQQLQEDLHVLTNTLAEGMGIQFRKLCNAKNSPVTDAEKEMFADMHRRYCDKIPGYLDAAEREKINVRNDAFSGFF